MRRQRKPASRSESQSSIRHTGKVASHLRVLVVEDNPMNQTLAERLLSNAGCRIEIAENGRVALDVLARKAFDVVLMDCEMPEIDGYQATQKIRSGKECPNVPIIAVTAHTQAGSRERCLHAGMNDYVAKPYRPNELISAIEKWTGTPEKPSR